MRRSNDKKKRYEKNKIHLSDLLIAGIIVNLILFASSFLFDYSNFQLVFAISTLLLIFGILIRKIVPIISFITEVGFLFVFLWFNFNYTFILGIAVLLSLLVLKIFIPNKKIPTFVFSLIPLFLLGHVLWFNILPFGYGDTWYVNVGAEYDESQSRDLYIIDEMNVLSLRQSYGSETWRTFRRDGFFDINFSIPVDLTGQEVEVTLEYDPTGPIFVNDKLFYDPAWGSSVNLGNFENREVFVYGKDRFNLTVPYKDVSEEEFLGITKYETLADYILANYETNIAENNGEYTGEVDLFEERKIIMQETSMAELEKSRFFILENVSDQYQYINQYVIDKNIESLEILFKSPLQVFLEDNNFPSVQIFMDRELNFGPYPKIRVDEEYKTTQEYIRAKFPKGVLVNDFTGYYTEFAENMSNMYIENVNSANYYDGFSSEPSTLEGTVRGAIAFYGVFNESIDLKLLKQDLNWYLGSDEVQVLIYDFYGDPVTSWVIDDNDGIGIDLDDSISEPKEYTFNYSLQKSGIYRIEFKHLNENPNPDFLMTNITFNSNKVIIDGRFSPWSNIKLYNTEENSMIRVRYWWGGYDQNVTFNDDQVLRLTEEDRGNWVDFNLANNKSVEFEKGFLIVERGHSLAAFPDSRIDMSLGDSIEITKAFDLEKNNIKLVNIEGLRIASTAGTQIAVIKVSTDFD